MALGISLFNIRELQETDKVLVAVSGGCDSLALTFLADEWCRGMGKELYTITIDHKIRIPTSTEEANYIHNLMEQHHIKHIIKTCEIGKIHSENDAREQRYNLIFDYMKEQNIKVVLFAHHLQDQAENFLIRLFRGSGIRGLASMQQISYRGDFIIVRPLLNEIKENLKQYLLDKGIKWCEDESNTDEKYLRNKIRNFLNSFEDKNIIARRINESVSVFQKAESIIEYNLNTNENTISNIMDGVNIIPLSYFNSMDEELQYRYLITLIKTLTKNTLPPRYEKIKRLIDIIKNSNKKYELANCVFEKRNDFVISYKKHIS